MGVCMVTRWTMGFAVVERASRDGRSLIDFEHWHWVSLAYFHAPSKLRSYPSVRLNFPSHVPRCIALLAAITSTMGVIFCWS